MDNSQKSVYGNQEGAAKGFNTTKKGAKSYHPLFVFVSEMKLLYHTWFRTGSAYTSNGIADFLKEVKTSLPETIEKVPAKITRSGHQMELKIYEHHFYKADWQELDEFIEAA